MRGSFVVAMTYSGKLYHVCRHTCDYKIKEYKLTKEEEEKTSIDLQEIIDVL